MMIGLKLTLKMKNLNGNYPKSTANYANKYFEEYISENSLKEAICKNRVPDNLDNVKNLDDVLRDTLREKCKTN